MQDLNSLQAQIGELIERGRLDHARRTLADAFKLDPDDSQSHLLAARIAVEEEDYESARRSIAAALSQNPDDMETRLLLFRLQRETQELVDAEQTILGLMHENPDTGHFYALYADLMLHAMRVDRAGALAAEALRLDPGDHLARIVTLLVHVIEGRISGARTELESLVREDPEALHVAWSVVTVLQAQHRYREATEIMRGILRANPDDAEALEGLISLRAASHWTTIPLWPLRRYGWAGSAMLWGAAVGSLMLARLVAPHLTSALMGFYIVYVVYSWVWPPLLEKWLRARGF